MISGNLGYQVEHHLYPDMPSTPLRRDRAKVREICQRYGLPYNSGPFHQQLGMVQRTILRLAFPGGKHRPKPGAYDGPLVRGKGERPAPGSGGRKLDIGPPAAASVGPSVPRPDGVGWPHGCRPRNPAPCPPERRSASKPDSGEAHPHGASGAYQFVHLAACDAPPRALSWIVSLTTADSQEVVMAWKRSFLVVANVTAASE